MKVTARILSVILFLLLVTDAQAQTDKSALWKTWKNTSEDDTTRLKAMSSFIAKNYLYINPDSAEIYAKQMQKFAHGRSPYYEGRALELEGISCSLRNKHLDAIKHFEKAQKVYMSFDSPEAELGRTSALGNLALTHSNLGNISLAVDYYTQVLEITERKKRYDYLSLTHNNIGLIYLKTEDYVRAKKYFEQALEVAEKTKDKRILGLVHDNLALVGVYTEDEAFVESHVKKADALFRSIGDTAKAFVTQSRIGLYYQENEEYVKAKTIFLEILDASDKLGDVPNVYNCLNQLAQLDFFLKNYKSAEEYGLRALELAKQSESKQTLKSSYEVLYQIYEAQGKFGKAFEMLKKHDELEAEIESEENKRSLIHQEYQYEYFKKEIGDSIRNVEKDKAHQITLQKERAEKDSYKSKLIMVIGGSLLLVIFLVILYNRFTVIKRQKRIIEQQKELVEEAAETKLQYERLKQQSLKEDLTNAAQEISRRQQWLEQFKEKLQKVKSLNIRADELNEVFLDVAQQMQLDSKNEELFGNIDQVNHEFFHLLKEKFPSITPKEQELCGLIRLNLSTKEIASIRNIEPHSIRIARSRLRKRLGLDRDDSLYDFLRDLGEYPGEA